MISERSALVAVLLLLLVAAQCGDARRISPRLRKGVKGESVVASCFMQPVWRATAFKAQCCGLVLPTARGCYHCV
jgi:hypothetical protein